MKKGILEVIVCMLLIATAVLPAAGIIENNEIEENDFLKVELSKELVTYELYDTTDLSENQYEPYKTTHSNTLEILIDPTFNSKSDTIEIGIDSTDSSELSVLSENDVYHIYEGLHWKLFVTAYWVPPQEKQICLWADTETLPYGATFYPPCNCGIGSVTSTLEWTPAIGQAGTYNIVFYAGESCYNPVGYFEITVVVHKYIPDPQYEYTIPAGQEWSLRVTARWVPPQEKQICLWVDTTSLPYGATFPPCHCSYGEVTSTLVWTPTDDQICNYYIITFFAGEYCGYYTFPFSILVKVTERVEGLHIDSKFQPVQVVYQHDTKYPPDDLTGGPCNYNAGLGMVAGKNTYLFGHPYNDRFKIQMTCCNSYNHAVTFQWVLKIFPGGKEIWRSDNVTVPANTVKTFTYTAPSECPGKAFQWERWNDAAKTKPGRIELSIEPDHTGGTSPCNCQKITVNVTLHKTHDLEVLFVPFTFGDGPVIPPELASIAQATSFDTWRWNTLNPWWNAIYPVREHGIFTMRNWLGNLQKNITINGIIINHTAVFTNRTSVEVTSAQRNRIRLQFFAAIPALGWMRLSDRIVFLVHPDIFTNVSEDYGWPQGGRCVGLAMPVKPNVNQNLKQGVLVDWDFRTTTVPPHEVSHTYGLDDCYIPPNNKNISLGYWVNRNIDIMNRRCLMWFSQDINNAWIKKPNFRDLLNRFTYHLDPEVLGIIGFIDRKDNVELNPWYKLDEGTVDLEWGTVGDYLIKAYNGNNILIAETGFNVSFMMSLGDLGEGPVDETIFAFRVEWLDEIKRIDIVNASSQAILVSRTRSQHPPEVTITSPSPGAKIKQGIYEIAWTSSDIDGDDLISYIFIRNTSEANWYILDFDNIGNSFRADFTNLPKDDYIIKIVTTDGFNTAEATSDFNIRSKGRGINILNFLENLLWNYPNMFPLMRLLQLQLDF